MENNYTLAELEKMAMEDECWEENPDLREIYIMLLHSFLIGA